MAPLEIQFKREFRYQHFCGRQVIELAMHPIATPYSEVDDLKSIHSKFEQIASAITRLAEYIPKLEEIDVIVEKFSTFHEVSTQALDLTLSCHEFNVPVEPAYEMTTKTESGFTCRNTKNKQKTKGITFERSFQLILDSLPKQYRTKKDHFDKIEKIIRCLYLHKDRYLTAQVYKEISSKTDVSSVHLTVYLNVLHKTGKVIKSHTGKSFKLATEI